MNASDPDQEIRKAAFQHVRMLSDIRQCIRERDMRINFKGHTVYLSTRARGIFKPKQMKTVLSIKSVIPKRGREVWYDDQNPLIDAVLAQSGTVKYAFQRKGRDRNANNKLLRDAKELEIPIIYFVGVAPSRYEAFFVYIDSWDPANREVGLNFAPGKAVVPPIPTYVKEREYRMQHVQQRLHQATFRETVMSAYGGRCAISGFPDERLLDAAHIIPDRDESLGQPIVQNGLPLSKLHHQAFDRHLIGIDPDYRVHVSKALLDQEDGPLLESLKKHDKQELLRPNREVDYPDRERLARRFEDFKAAA